jgi:predicted  nucleic acid-binding Zn-ribbon protein
LFREALSGLEKLDIQINALLRSMLDGRSRIKAVMDERKSLEAARNGAVEEHEQALLKLKDIELELSAAGQEIEKLKKQRLQLSDEKSLKLIEQRLDALAGKNSQLEDNWFAATDDVERAGRLRELAVADFKNSDSEREIDRVNRDLQVARQELQELQDRRISFFADLGAEWAGRYEKLRKRYPEKRVVFAVDSEFCPGCNMQLNHRVYERMRYNEEVLCCSSCGSILFWPLRGEGNA